jgi:hypothetical protein
MSAFKAGQSPVPHRLVGEQVWARRHGEQLVIFHVGQDGPVEVARHQLTSPGNPRVDDAHFPPVRPVRQRRRRARGAQRKPYSSPLGGGAGLWLTKAELRPATPQTPLQAQIDARRRERIHVSP